MDSTENRGKEILLLPETGEAGCGFSRSSQFSRSAELSNVLTAAKRATGWGTGSDQGQLKHLQPPSHQALSSESARPKGRSPRELLCVGRRSRARDGDVVSRFRICRCLQFRHTEKERGPARHLAPATAGSVAIVPSKWLPADNAACCRWREGSGSSQRECGRVAISVLALVRDLSLGAHLVSSHVSPSLDLQWSRDPQG